MSKPMSPGRKGIRRVGISTGGGDAPGLNAVIRAVVLAANNQGWEAVGIRDGYNGIFLPDQYPDGGLIRLTPERVQGITHLGGTIIGTTNTGNPLRYPTRLPDGTMAEVDRTDDLVKALEVNRIDAVVAVGGDGSLTIANTLARKGVRIVGVPKTIDNDLSRTVITFGFDSAVSFATECLDRLHSTAEAHRRVMVVEVMGRYAGWIALHSGVAGGADVILIPEIPYDVDKVAACLRDREARGARFSIVVVAEGARPIDGSLSLIEAAKSGHAERLGGAGALCAKQLEERAGKETRHVVLGHLQRGGSPTAFDRTLATRFGGKAVELLLNGQFGKMVANHPPDLVPIPIGEVVGKIKTVPLDYDLLLTARRLGVSFGDQ